MEQDEKGFLVIDNISFEEAKYLIGARKGRWITKTGWAKCMGAEAFAILTHNFPAMTKDEYVEFNAK